MSIRIAPLCLVLLGLVFALSAALTEVSSRKGLLRLSASAMVALGFAVGAVSQVINEKRLWPGCLGLGVSCFLAWIGFRKFKRDPEGRTPAASML